MSTATLTNTIKDPSGTAQVGVVVEAVLMPGSAFRADNSEVVRYESTTTDSNGVWSLTLERNDQITPSGTYWQITEKLNSPLGPSTWACLVTTNSSLLAALATPPPAYDGNIYLTQAAADARYLSDVAGVINVVDEYNLVGDGVTDNAVGLAAAIADASANQVLYFPAGNYLCSVALSTGTKPLYFLGSGRNNTTLTISATAAVGLDIGDGIATLNGAGIIDMTVRQSGAGITTALVRCRNVYQLLFRAAKFTDSTVASLRLISCGHVLIDAFSIFNWNTAGSAIGLILDNACNGVDVQCQYEGKTAGTFRLIEGRNAASSNVRITGHASEAYAQFLYVNNGSGVTRLSLYSVTARDVGTAFVDVQSGATVTGCINDNTVTGDGSATGIANGGTMSGCSIDNNVFTSFSTHYSGVSATGIRGTGSPEGVIAAGVGSTYHRLDGGAGTCLYIKETGTGNTGWVAK